MHILGTNDDYVMLADISDFDNYTLFDLLGIRNDFATLNERNRHLSPQDLAKARSKYLDVISYIESRLRIKSDYI